MKPALLPGEADLLKEVSYELDNTGKVTPRQARIPTVANIRFALQMFTQHAAPGYVPDWGNDVYGSLQKALKIRHRLTHPKGLDDVIVTDEELEVVNHAFEWYRLTLLGAFKQASELHRLEFERLTGTSIVDEPEAGQEEC